MKPSELSILLAEGEGTMLEYKESLSSSFAREMVALANTAGGKMLLGVRDDGTVKGIADSNALRARIQDIARNCDPPVTVLVEPVGEVMVVTVRESDAKPVQCSDGFFWRQGAVTQKLTRDEIRDFFRSEGVIRFDLSLCPRFRYPQDFDRKKYDAWLRLSGITGRPRTEDVLVNTEAAERSGGRLVFRNAGSFSSPGKLGVSSTRPTSPASSSKAPTRSTSSTARTSRGASLPTSRTACASSSETHA
jgi:ATP-dependent DNA helicase RecG